MCVCESQLLMGLRTEQTVYSFKRHVRRKINQQKIEQQTQQEGVKLNTLRFKNILDENYWNDLLISHFKKLIFYKSHSISCIFFVNSVMCYIKVRQIMHCIK